VIVQVIGANADAAANPVADASDSPADLAELRYRRLVDHSPDAICVHEGGRIVYVNAAALRWMAARASDQMVGHPITEFVHPDSVPPMLARIAALRTEGDASEPSEAWMLRFDGTILAVEAVSVLTVWEGNPAYQVVFRDLTAQKTAEATLRYQAALVNHVSDAIIATTCTGMVTSWNPAAEAIYRRPAMRALALPVGEAVGAPLDPAAVVAGGGVVHTTHRALDGTALAVRVSAAAMDNGYVLACSDQTALRRAENHFQTVVSSLDDGVVVVGCDGRIESVNPAALRILGIRAGDPVYDKVNRAAAFPVYGSDGQPLGPDKRPLHQILHRREQLDGNHVIGVNRADNGERVWLSSSCRLLNPDDPDHSAVLISFADITAQRLASERLAYEAAHDSLTGLPNRAHIVSRLSAALHAGDRDAVAAVLFVDLDNLKTVNDTLGHDAGDDLIRIAAKRLRHGVRSGDVVARLGGDEFVALLCGPVDDTDLGGLAARIHAALREPVVIAGTSLPIGASIGVALIEDNDQRGADDVLRDADLAMYQAKTDGRGRTHYFTEQLRRPRAAGHHAVGSH
jgi:diguanylate cyclase (GGDEF)-like protein/PAS domain S-box-containing protein